MGEDEAPLLAPGFRFHPTDDELVSYYLKRKVSAKPFRVDAIAEIDLYKSEPWDLPGQSRLKSRDMEWYFFTALDKKYGHGSRTNRSTEQGYWKTTGMDHPVFHNSRIVGARKTGARKTLVFHHGRAPKGDRTNWVMHEYRLEDEDLANKGVPQDAFVVCRIFQKSGAGPKNGEQYGAPFVEEEWEDEEKVMVVVSKVEKDHDDGSGSGSGDTISHAPMQLPAILPMAEFEKPDSGDPFEAADPFGFLEVTEEDQDISHVLQLHAGGQNFLDDGNGSTNFPELYQTLPTVEDENYMDLDDLCPAEDEDGNDYYPNSQNSMHYAPPPSQNIPPAEDGHFVELNDLVGPVDTNPSGFELIDEYLTYFEATNDNLDKYLSTLGSCSSKLEPEMADPSVHPEKIAKEHAVESASSKRKAKTCDDLGDKIVVDDLGYDDGNDGWGKSLAKRLHGMLGSIPSAPAFAAEDPLKGMAKYAGQSSGAHSGSSINVQAGMLCVSDFTVTYTSRKHWPLQDDRYYATEYLMSSSLSLGEKSSRSLMFQSGFYLCFLWVLLLAVTCKVGLYVYTR